MNLRDIVSIPEERKGIRKAFLIALAMAVALFLPFVIAGGGTLMYYGDFNCQQIPFYRECISAIQSGNMGWNWHTDLGANFIGSYSFYTLGSPFFWIAAVFPASISQYLIAPLLALKIACSSLTAYLYIRRFTEKSNSALIGALLYAFSGFSLYSLYFNHFQEVIVFFPLFLVALEEAVINKRRGFFAVMVAISALVNYFFFVGECVFLVIYLIVRITTCKEFCPKIKGTLLLALESIIGVLMAGILLVPSALAVLDVPRAASILNGWDFMFYSPSQRYGAILESMFFPPEIPIRSYMFGDSSANAANIALYLPLFSMAGVIAFVKGTKKHWAKTLLLICLVIMLVPALNSAFVLFKGEYYARWFYMPELICCLATVYTLEHSELDMKFGVKFCAVISAVMVAFAFLSPFEKSEYSVTAEGVPVTETEMLPRFLALPVDIRLIVSVIICAVSIAVLGIMLRYRKKATAERFMKTMTATTVVFGMVLGYYFLISGTTLDSNTESQKQMINAHIELEDEFSRVEVKGTLNNAGMLLGKGSLTSFISIVPGSVFGLYDMLDYDRGVVSEPSTSMYALRALTGVKYYIVPSGENTDSYDIPKTYEYLETQNGYDIYTSPYVLPMGFAYDSYIPESRINSISHIDNAMISAAILTDEQIEKYADILSPLTDDEIYRIGDDTFAEEAEERITDGIESFEITTDGFTSETNYEAERLVMFSVPFDKGWSAEIDGEAVQIDEINGGFMALRVKAGAQKIVFTYKTSGLDVGIILTVSGIGVLIGYLVICKVIKKKQK